MDPVRSELRIFRAFAPSNHGGGYRQNRYISACLYMARVRSEFCIFRIFAPVGHGATPPEYVYFRMFVHGPCEVRIAHFPYIRAFQPWGGTPPEYENFRMFVHGACEVRMVHFPYIRACRPWCEATKIRIFPYVCTWPL